MIVRKSGSPAICLLALLVLARPGPAQLATPTAPPPAAATVTPLGKVPDWNLLAQYGNCITENEFATALEEIYLEKSRYPVPWIIGPDGVKIQTGQPELPNIQIPLARRGQPLAQPPRFWKRPSELPKLNGRPPLSDLHIAIDPGHIGGGYAVMEERHLSFSPGQAIQEGDLTLLTARVLETRLKALGAYVSLVRQNDKPVTTRTPAEFRPLAIETLRQAGFTTPKDTYAGIQGEEKLLTIQWQSEKFFYRDDEIHARAVHVNETIKPDLVLCLHFNAESWGDATAPQFSPANHFHILVNGCYSPAELVNQDTRFELLQRLLSGTHQEEIGLAKALAPALAKTTGLPPYNYLTPNARQVAGNPYIYARNLLANRLYQCPVLYFEPYVMNHEMTYRRLLLGHWIGRTLVEGSLQTSPIEDYAQGIVQGLLDYYQTQRPS
jgi:hypothetical protein